MSHDKPQTINQRTTNDQPENQTGICQPLPEVKATTVSLTHADDPQCAYLLQEVSIFNNRVVWYLEQQQKQEVFALGASGALWAYILQQGQSPFVFLLVAIPFAISAILALKSHVLTQSMQESMSYLAELETRFKLENDMGWVHYYRRNSGHYKKRWRRSFWALLILVNCALAVGFLNWSPEEQTDMIESGQKMESSNSPETNVSPIVQ